MRKLTLIAGVAIGYVLGSRAGRERYEQIKSGAGNVAHNPKVQAAAGRAQEAAKEKVVTPPPPRPTRYAATGPPRPLPEQRGRMGRVSDLLPHPATGGLFASPVPPGTGWPGDPAIAATPVAPPLPQAYAGSPGPATWPSWTRGSRSAAPARVW